MIITKKKPKKIYDDNSNTITIKKNTRAEKSKTKAIEDWSSSQIDWRGSSLIQCGMYLRERPERWCGGEFKYFSIPMNCLFDIFFQFLFLSLAFSLLFFSVLFQFFLPFHYVFFSWITHGVECFYFHFIYLMTLHSRRLGGCCVFSSRLCGAKKESICNNKMTIDLMGNDDSNAETV